MKFSLFSKMLSSLCLICLLCFAGTGCNTTDTQVNDGKVLPVIGRGYTAVKDNVKLVSGVNPEMLNVDFWVKNLGSQDGTVMTGEEIKAFNQKIIDEMPEIYDLKAYSSSLEKDELTAFIKEYKLPTDSTIGDDGKQLTKDFFDQLLANTNLDGIKSSNPIRYGITVRKCDLRTFPTDAVAYTNGKYDRLQETACPLGEPLLILHESKDNEWAFVQLYNYRGWMNKKNIAIAKKNKQLFDYMESKDFMIVVDPFMVENSTSKEEIELVMGSRMNLVKEGEDYYTVSIPGRDKKGSLIFSEINIAKTENLNKGYLEYTYSNIIKQAFKLLGTAYDWGGKEHGYDCSSYIMSIYRTMGIQLPRNSGQQAKTPGIGIAFPKSASTEQRLKSLETLKPGAALYMPGHIMLYLGSYEGSHYIIHDFWGYTTTTGASMEYIPVFSVTVSSVQNKDDYGIAYLKKLTTAIEFKSK